MLEIFMTKGFIAAGVVGVIALLFTEIGLLPNKTPIVTIDDGQVQGRQGFSREGNEYLEFLAIPYAEPPIGELRFEAPVPVKSWKGVKQTTRYPPLCLQLETLSTGRVKGSEDCLFLNVFTHDVNPDKKKPVMVYIHGGGFVQGSSAMYVPTYFMDHDIVMVTINYRLGPLGFLNTGDELIRGNMGLKDQNLAMKWVKKNIAKFGGDPTRITLFGESAGAASVHLHIISPKSQGLFQKAIAQSGTATCPFAYKKSLAGGMEYVKSLGCPTKDKGKLVNCLKEMDASKIVQPQISAMIPINEFIIFGPTVETFVQEDTFLTERPEDILKSGKFAKVPFMLGVTSGEGGLRTGRLEAMPELIPEIDSGWENLAHYALSYEDLKGNTEAIREIRGLYFGEKKFTENVHEFKKNFSVLNSDAIFFEPTHSTALIHAKQGVPTYLYYFDYSSAVMPDVYSIIRASRHDDWLLAELKSLWAILVDLAKKNYLESEGPHEFGVTHANDLFQLWNIEGVSSFFMGKEGEDYHFSQSFVKAFVDFAKDEKPLKFKDTVWSPIQPETSLKYMLMDNNEAKMIDEPFSQRLPFWESLRRTNNLKTK